MGFLTPSALALAALAIPIIIFYMLKLRRQPAPVSSLFLWQQVLEDRQANAPWQRLKRNLLLLLQLLILALLVMALARPYFIVNARVQGNVVLLLDASASMQATDLAPHRFAAAQEAATRLIERLKPDDAVTLIAVEHTPRVLAAATTDRHQLRLALDAARPSNGPANWADALALAAANTANLADATIVIISDGALGQDVIERHLPHLSAPVEFIPVGQSADNQGLVALSLRDGPTGLELFLRVANAAPQPRRRLVEVYIDDQLFDAREVNIPAQDSVGLTLSGLPLNVRQVRAGLSGQDDLAADDAAWLVRSGAPAQVLLVSEGNLFLERALALLPNIDLRRALPDQALPQTAFDLIIFDRTVPALSEAQANTLPQSHLLFIAPPRSTSLFEVSGVMTRPQVTRLERQHPLLTYVELNQLNIAQAQAIIPPPWAQTAIDAQNGPLLIAGQFEGRRIAALAFDLHQSDLPLQIDFPILILNLTRWLLPAENLEQGQMLQAGQSFNLPPAPSANALQIKAPDGQAFTLGPDQNTFNNTGALGVYQIFSAGSPTPLEAFAVNLLAEAETDIQPRQLPNLNGAPAVERSLNGRWEWWWPLAAVGLAVLFTEWWVYWRGEVR